LNKGIEFGIIPPGFAFGYAEARRTGPRRFASQNETRGQTEVAQKRKHIAQTCKHIPLLFARVSRHSGTGGTAVPRIIDFGFQIVDFGFKVRNWIPAFRNGLVASLRVAGMTNTMNNEQEIKLGPGFANPRKIGSPPTTCGDLRFAARIFAALREVRYGNWR
jgi:hypothetical protein